MRIEDHPIKDEIQTDIQYTMRYAEIDACVAAGLDWWKWETGFYPIELKTEVVAWHQMSSIIQLHTQDAVARKRK